MGAPGESVLVADTDLKAWAAAPTEQTCTRGLTGVACKHQGEKRVAAFWPGQVGLGPLNGRLFLHRTSDKVSGMGSSVTLPIF